MADVSIKERILRQVKRRLDAELTGLTQVLRWDGRGRFWTGSAFVERVGHLGCVFDAGEERIENGEQGNIGVTVKFMPVVIGIVLQTPADEQVIHDAVEEDWKAQVELAVMDDPFWTEDTSLVRLALDSKITDLPPPIEGEAPVEMVSLTTVEIEYRHNRNDPYTGPGIVKLTE